MPAGVSPDHAAVVFQVVASFVALIVGVSMWMMVSVSRSSRCRWCEHCQKEIKKEQEVRAEKRHTSYHQFSGGNLSNCTDPDCRGRK